MQPTERQTETARVLDAERRFVKGLGWLFPVVGVGVSMLTGGGFWAWVDGLPPWGDWYQVFTWRAIILGGTGTVFWGIWAALAAKPSKGWVAVVLAALGFAMVETLVRISPVQTAFWLATRARLDVHGPNFMSEVCYVRLEEAAGRVAEGPGVILTGTSQMLCGVDELELGRMLAPTPVVRREVSGMVPQNMLAMWPWIPFRRGDRCVQLRSEMDFTNQEEFRTAWYRPFLNWKSLPMVLRNSGGGVCARHWRELADCAMAASLEGWRMRDGWREIAMTFWGRMASAREESGKTRTALAGNEMKPLVWSDWEWRAFEREADMLREEGVEFWVFEGDVNPLLHTAERMALRAEVERRLLEGAVEGKWRFVSLEEQGAGIGPDDWLDMTHLNQSGREKLTRMMGRTLGKEVPHIGTCLVRARRERTKSVCELRMKEGGKLLVGWTNGWEAHAYAYASFTLLGGDSGKTGSEGVPPAKIQGGGRTANPEVEWSFLLRVAGGTPALTVQPPEPHTSCPHPRGAAWGNKACKTGGEAIGYNMKYSMGDVVSADAAPGKRR